MTRDELVEVDLHLDATIDLILSKSLEDGYVAMARTLIGSACFLVAANSGRAIKERVNALKALVFHVKVAKDFETEQFYEELGYLRTKFSDMIQQGGFVAKDMEAVFRAAQRHYST